MPNGLVDGETFWHGTYNNFKINFAKKFKNISNNNINECLNTCLDMLDDIIIAESSYIFNAIPNKSITIKSQKMTGEYLDVLGWAEELKDGWEIVLDVNNFNDKVSKTRLNSRTVSKNVVVVMHELLHVLGIGTHDNWYNYINSYNKNGVKNNGNNYFYDGKYATIYYKEVLKKLYPKDKNIQYMKNLLPIQGGDIIGTSLVHLEEDGVRYLIHNDRKIYYKSIEHDIITGWLSTEEWENSYFTKLTAGFLQDLGYTINYDSKHLVSPKLY